MTKKLEQVVDGLLHLPGASRAYVAERLIASLDPATEQDYTDLWLREAQCRSEEIKRGTVRCKTAEQVFRDVRKKLR